MCLRQQHMVLVLLLDWYDLHVILKAALDEHRLDSSTEPLFEVVY